MRHNHETAKADLTAVNLKLQEKEAELAEKIKDYYLMEVRNEPISLVINAFLRNIFNPAIPPAGWPVRASNQNHRVRMPFGCCTEGANLIASENIIRYVLV